MAVDAAPPPAPAPAAVATAPAATGTSFYVDGDGYRYGVTGNTLLPQARIEAILKAAATPKAAIDALNNAYVDAGYLFVVIGGEVDNKLVALRVIEGRITEIDAPADMLPFVRNLRERSDLTRNQLLRETAMLDIYGQRQGVRPAAGFAKAAEVGGTRLTVTEEPIPGAKPWSAGLSFSNLSGRFSSRYTVGGNASVRPGNGLELTAGYNQGLPGLTSESSGASYKSGSLGGSIVTPWGLYGWSYLKTNYQIGESGAPFYPAGDNEQGGINGTQIVFASPTSRIVTTQALTRYSSLQTVDLSTPGMPEFLYTLVDQNYTVGSAGATVSTSGSLGGQNAGFNAGVTLAKGLTGRSGSFLSTGPGYPTPRFLLVQGNATLQSSLPYDLTAALTVTAQHADATLPQAQQWVLGGYGNLSAWLPAVLIGDSGILARATLATASVQWSGYTLSAGAYAEAGVARLDHRGSGEPYTRGLGDAGLSLTGSTPFGTTLSLAYAFPVWYRNVDGAVRHAVDSNRANLYFTLTQTF